jgi:hypothetical protein
MGATQIKEWSDMFPFDWRVIAKALRTWWSPQYTDTCSTCNTWCVYTRIVLHTTWWYSIIFLMKIIIHQWSSTNWNFLHYHFLHLTTISCK